MTKNIFKTFNKNLNSLLPIGFNKVSLKLGKSYFFNKLSFRIQIKGISVFIGPNGTGKSTCIKLLAGLIEPDSGEVIFPRNEINSRIIGYVPQKIILLRRSVKENLSHALSISGYPKNEKFSRIDEIIKFAKLKHLANISARNLSMGQQQLVSIMRALALRPSFLFLDEPCANLDIRTFQVIENLLKTASSCGIKIILVTHDLFQAKRLADEILFFHNGKITEQTRAKDFFKNPKSKQAKYFQNGLLLKE